MTATASVIDASDLTKRYGALAAVAGVSLRVVPGEIYALLGLNGAGKTTMIRMLLGMVRPTVGQVALFGEEVRRGRHEMWSGVGYLIETPSAYPELTVVENLRAVARLRGLTSARAVDDVIERLGLRPCADHRARTLSLGNAQRLGLAKALIHRPDLLILDEPANGLDPAGVAEFRALLLGLVREQGVTVLLSSHILTEVARLATRIGVIDHGRLVQEIARDDLATLARPRLSVAALDRARAAEALRVAGPTAHPDGDGFVVEDERAVQRPDDVAALLVGLLGAKATLVASEADWAAYFGFLTQANAIGGMVVFGLAVTWLFGREFSQDTAKDLLALPTGRGAIVTAKFAVGAFWCLVLTGYIHVLGLAVGAVPSLPAWSGAVAGRGYLPGVTFMIAAVFLAQIVAALGYGDVFPWSVPALFSGLAGPDREQPGVLGHALVVLVGIGGAWATAAWWTRADRDR